MNDIARRTIVALGLRPHPEGGFYRETYRSPDVVTTARGERSALTSIYFLLTSESFSAFHRIRSDEAWHFYRGDAIAIELLGNDGSYERRILSAAETPQTIVPAGVAFASHVPVPDGYALVGCDVAPGFAFEDFALCDRAELVGAHPERAELIARLTR